MKNIKPGDEITYHYGRNYFDSFIKAVGCKCMACAKKRAEIRSRRSRRRASVRGEAPRVRKPSFRRRREVGPRLVQDDAFERPQAGAHSIKKTPAAGDGFCLPVFRGGKLLKSIVSSSSRNAATQATLSLHAPRAGGAYCAILCREASSAGGTSSSRVITQHLCSRRRLGWERFGPPRK
jgi:hypothetical protein